MPHWTSGQVLLVSLSSCLLNAVMTDEHMQSLGGHGVMRLGSNVSFRLGWSSQWSLEYF